MTINTNSLAVCLRSLAEAPPAASLQDKMIVVCKGAEMTLRKDGALPDSLKPGEVCWVLPRGDVRLPLEFQYDAQEVQTVVVLRFEGDRNFALHAANLLASEQTDITEEDLAQFVAGQWSELMTIQKITLEQLSARNSGAVDRFRTHLSLLLQENGFRCVGIESVELQSSRMVPPKTRELPDNVSQELHTAIKKATSQSGWNNLLDQLDEAGFQPRESDIEYLENLGSDYRDRKVSADDASLQIRRMIERNNLETRLIAERVSRWNATEVKMRLLETLGDQPEEYMLAAGESLDKPEKIPSTWYMLRRHKVDEKLQKYLQTSAGKLKHLLESAMQRQTGIENKSKLASAQATLKRISNKLEMTPTLGAGPGGLKRQQRKLDELAQAVRQSVTAIQLAEGLLRSLASENYAKDQYLATVADLETTLATLEREINDRKNVYGV